MKTDQMATEYLNVVTRRFQQYKKLGERTFDQLPDEALFHMYHPDSNSIAIIVKHLWGNMLSRWTNFLTEDGEKPWRKRDAEFENDLQSREELLKKWEEGWECLFAALGSLGDNDLDRLVTIRGEALTVLDVLLRQLTHYAYHVGQIVYAGKLLSNGQWTSLSIPRGASDPYNASMLGSGS